MCGASKETTRSWNERDYSEITQAFFKSFPVGQMTARWRTVATGRITALDLVRIKIQIKQFEFNFSCETAFEFQIPKWRQIQILLSTLTFSGRGQSFRRRQRERRWQWWRPQWWVESGRSHYRRICTLLGERERDWLVRVQKKERSTKRKARSLHVRFAPILH